MVTSKPQRSVYTTITMPFDLKKAQHDSDLEVGIVLGLFGERPIVMVTSPYN